MIWGGFILLAALGGLVLLLLSRRLVPVGSPRTLSPAENFLAAYFHQDWRLDDPSWVAVVDRFRKENPKAHVALVVAEIKEKLASERVKNSVDSWLDASGCRFNPGVRGLTGDEWLRQVLARLESRE